MPMATTTNSAPLERNLATLCIHPKGVHEHDPITGAVIPPISLSTTFAQVEPSKPIGVHANYFKKKVIFLLFYLPVGF